MKDIAGTGKKIIYWLILVLLMFFYVAYDKDEPHIHWYELLFVLTYFIASLIISYLLIPNFLYRKKYFKFWISVVFVLLAVGIFEEQVLEQWFYPDTRARVTKVLHTFLEIFPPIFIFTGYKFAWDVFEKQSKIDKLQRISAENELQFLNSQINPHFLFNNLNNIYSYALEQSPKTPEIILQLSSILRYMLYDCRKPYVLLSDEIENLKQFTALYGMQIGSDPKISFDVDADDTNIMIVPLILIVFVENAFKHSSASQTSDIKIDISIKVKNKKLIFTCNNTYQNMTNTNDLNKGIGLENVRSKLNLTYPDKHHLNIEKAHNQYNVLLKMNLNND